MPLSYLTAQAYSYRKTGTAVVCVDRLPKDWDGDSVTADIATYKRLAMIMGPRHLTNVQARLRGFKRALAERKIHIVPKPLSPIGIPANCIFAGNDMIAFGALMRFARHACNAPNIFQSLSIR